MIGTSNTVTPEITIYKTDEGYLVECEGAALAGPSATIQDAHGVARWFAWEHNRWTTCGLTEVFGRNRQFIQGPRGGWHRFK